MQIWVYASSKTMLQGKYSMIPLDFSQWKVVNVTMKSSFTKYKDSILTGVSEKEL